jgi:alkyldihydroxyacetonephosphate synthase
MTSFIPKSIRDRFKKSAAKPVRQEIVSNLKKSLGDIVSTESDILKSHQRDSWALSEIQDFQGQEMPLPIAVVMAETTEQVSQTLKICNEAGVTVIPYGGGSGVCGAIKTEAGSVVLSMGNMSGVVDLDKENQRATFWAGTNGLIAEEAVQEKGLTIGHWPQSVSISTVGGWVATKASGQYSTAYGNIEDIVMDMEAVLPDGSVLNTRQAPRAAAGFDLRQMFLGTEGTHGIVTKVTFSLREKPEASKGQAFHFSNFESGINAMKEFIRDGWNPAVVRLYDETETQRHFGEAFPEGQSALLLLHEGPKDLVDVQTKNVKASCENAGGNEASQQVVEAWLQKRNKVPTFRELLEQGIVADTIEVSATWDKIPDLYDKVTSAVKAIPGVVMSSGHSSHSYRSGTNIYFTFAAMPGDKDIMQDVYNACWEATMNATIEVGGSIVHHHGVGRVRKDFLSEEIGGEGVELLRKIKSAIDPNNILNPGTLLPDKNTEASPSQNNQYRPK